MAKNTIVWSPTALIQRRIIFKYWNERIGSNLYSTKILNSINGRIKVIKQNPNAFKSIGFKNIRECAMGDYSIYYQVIENQISIISFWGNRQDPDKLLEILTNK